MRLAEKHTLTECNVRGFGTCHPGTAVQQQSALRIASVAGRGGEIDEGLHLPWIEKGRAPEGDIGRIVVVQGPIDHPEVVPDRPMKRALPQRRHQVRSACRSGSKLVKRGPIQIEYLSVGRQDRQDSLIGLRRRTHVA